MKRLLLYLSILALVWYSHAAKGQNYVVSCQNSQFDNHLQISIELQNNAPVAIAPGNCDFMLQLTGIPEGALDQAGITMLSGRWSSGASYHQNTFLLTGTGTAAAPYILSVQINRKNNTLPPAAIATSLLQTGESDVVAIVNVPLSTCTTVQPLWDILGTIVKEHNGTNIITQTTFQTPASQDIKPIIIQQTNSLNAGQTATYITNMPVQWSYTGNMAAAFTPATGYGSQIDMQAGYPEINTTKKLIASWGGCSDTADIAINSHNILNCLAGLREDSDDAKASNDNDENPYLLFTPNSQLILSTSKADAGLDKTQNSLGDKDFWLTKIDNQGNKLWDKVYGGDDKDEASTILLTQDNNYLLAGTSKSDISGTKSQDSYGSEDFWLVKIDQNGNKIWDRTYGGSDKDELKKVVELANGDLVLAGTSKSGANGTKSQNSRDGSEDYWVVKTHANGNEVWDKRFGGEEKDELADVATDSFGNIYIVGISESENDGDKSQDTRGGKDYWVVKIASNGSKVWDKRFGGNGKDEAVGIVLINDSTIVLAGQSDSEDGNDKSEDRRHKKDFWLVAIDQNGSKLWDKTLGGKDDEELADIKKTPAGNIMIAGTTKANNLQGETSTPITDHLFKDGEEGEEDYVIIEIDAGNGHILDGIRVGGSEKDEAHSLATDGQGHWVVCGLSESNANGDKTSANSGSKDIWMMAFERKNRAALSVLSGGECDADTVELFGTASGNISYYHFYKNNQFVAGSFSPQTKSVWPAGTHQFKVKAIIDDNGIDCLTESLEMPLTINEQARFTQAINDTVICKGNYLVLDTDAPCQWERWTQTGRSILSLSDQQDTIYFDELSKDTLIAVSGTSNSCQSKIMVEVKEPNRGRLRVALQGVYSDALSTGGIMKTELASQGVLNRFLLTNDEPLPIDDLAPAIKSGLMAVPDTVVDVVAVVLRDSVTMQPVDTVHAWLSHNGFLMDYQTGENGLCDCPTDNSVVAATYFVQISHRNHLPVMTNTALQVNAGGTDFIDLMNYSNIYGGGAIITDFINMTAVMPAGDVTKTNTNEINASDFFRIMMDNSQLIEGYQNSDANLDGYVNSIDFNIVSKNNDFLYFSTVP